MSDGPWRQPDEESVDLYPGLVVHDGRVSGSITVGQSRLPLWAIIGTAIRETWESVESNWSPTEAYGFTAHDLAAFLYDLMELRGEFGRLLLVLANAERQEMIAEQEDESLLVADAWWDVPAQRQPVIDQLRRCLLALETIGA